MVDTREHTISAPYLLSTKLFKPNWRPGLISRPSLISGLAQIEARRLTVVSAAAGFGKTTPLAEWLSTTSSRVCWVSLNETDNDPIVFWSYVVAALQQISSSIMKAAVYKEYGSPDVISLEELPLPSVEANQVRVRVNATTVTSADSRLRAMRIPPGFKLMARMMFGFFRPKNQVLGSEFSGIIDAIGPDVKNFNIGDKVFGAFEGRGTHAEYFTMSEDDAIEHVPEGFTYEGAASLPFGALTSLIFLTQMGQIQAGQKILIIGASGALGTAAVQLAKHYGAEVSGVCSTRNIDLVKSLGATHVIDYTKTDFSEKGEQYDLVYETVGKVSFTDCKKALKPGGKCLMAATVISDYLRMLFNPLAGSKKLITGVAIFKKEELSLLKKLMREGAIRPVIDKIYALENISEAHAHVDSGHKKGSVVIRIGNFS